MQTPLHTCEGLPPAIIDYFKFSHAYNVMCVTGHKNWVLCIAWSPNSKYLVSGCKNGMIMSWNVETGKRVGPPMTGHKQWITALCWAPYHLSPECRM